MTRSAWIAFAVADRLMTLVPGPVLLCVVSHAVTHGRRTADAVVAATPRALAAVSRGLTL